MDIFLPWSSQLSPTHFEQRVDAISGGVVKVSVCGLVVGGAKLYQGAETSANPRICKGPQPANALSI